jgi:hypothetical protein
LAQAHFYSYTLRGELSDVQDCRSSTFCGGGGGIRTVYEANEGKVVTAEDATTTLTDPSVLNDDDAKTGWRWERRGGSLKLSFRTLFGSVDVKPSRVRISSTVNSHNSPSFFQLLGSNTETNFQPLHELQEFQEWTWFEVCSTPWRYLRIDIVGSDNEADPVIGELEIEGDVGAWRQNTYSGTSNSWEWQTEALQALPEANTRVPLQVRDTRDGAGVTFLLDGNESRTFTRTLSATTEFATLVVTFPPSRLVKLQALQVVAFNWTGTQAVSISGSLTGAIYYSVVQESYPNSTGWHDATTTDGIVPPWRLLLFKFPSGITLRHLRLVFEVYNSTEARSASCPTACASHEVCTSADRYCNAQGKCQW